MNLVGTELFIALKAQIGMKQMEMERVLFFQSPIPTLLSPSSPKTAAISSEHMIEKLPLLKRCPRSEGNRSDLLNNSTRLLQRQSLAFNSTHGRVYTHTHDVGRGQSQLGYLDHSLDPNRNSWAWGKYCWVRGAFGQFHCGEAHLTMPSTSLLQPHFSYLPASVPCSLYSNKSLSLLFPSLSQNERMCLETVAEGAILFLKKKL